MVHGDDFLAVGDGKCVDGLKDVLKSAYGVKVETLGGDQGDSSEICVLNRVLRRTADGYRVKADPRHAEAVVHDLGLAGAKGGRLLGTKEEKLKHSEVSNANQSDGTSPTLIFSICNTHTTSRFPRGNVIGKGRGGVVILGSECAKTESELDKAEETTSYNKREVNLNIQSASRAGHMHPQGGGQFVNRLAGRFRQNHRSGFNRCEGTWRRSGTKHRTEG